MLLPQVVVDNVNKLYELHKDLANGDDDQRRQLTKMIAEQNCYDLGVRWGTKKAGPGNPQSKDAIAYFLSGGPDVMDVWDWQNGTTRAPQVHVNQAPDYPSLTGQYFINVSPINHLGNITPIPIPPTPGYDDTELKRRITALEAEVNKLQTDVSELDSQMKLLALSVEGCNKDIDSLVERINNFKSTGRSFGHAHPAKIE